MNLYCLFSGYPPDYSMQCTHVYDALGILDVGKEPARLWRAGSNTTEPFIPRSRCHASIYRIAPRRKPAKPYEGFPMIAHPSGQWAKKINTKLHYFGAVADPEGALTRLKREFPYIKKGETPPALDMANGCTLHQLSNNFLAYKEESLKGHELSRGMAYGGIGAIHLWPGRSA